MPLVGFQIPFHCSAALTSRTRTSRIIARLFLIDGYALIYRAFFALISRPLTTSRGENTSAAWGIVNFLQRLLQTHRPDYLGWVHDSGLSFRHERYPAYKATREKLTDELQADFDRRHGTHLRHPRREPCSSNT